MDPGIRKQILGMVPILGGSAPTLIFFFRDHNQSYWRYKDF